MPATDPAGRGPTLLDAAIGTRLIALGLHLDADDPALWVVDYPEMILDLHRRDVAAGAEAVLTSTFGANRAWLDRFGRASDWKAINARAAALARQAAGPDGLVLGSTGPTAAGPDLRDQAGALAEAGVDALVLETHSLEQAVAALSDLRPGSDFPIVASLFRWTEGATRRLEDAGATALGVNCVVGMAEAVRIARSIRAETRLPIWLKPSAGLPGGPIESPETFASFAPAIAGLGEVMVGGCCGTTDAHIAALRSGLDAARPGS
ncbi:homocysteine S-methyltransferase family protein [Tundrisphaera sp. TA3]|uniref:homocysteine S-methyltransferase family protein n=1 Tax=Tundrisphaera sp. TA3 TaxID=3435775 RepID=UPI003EBFD5C2